MFSYIQRKYEFTDYQIKQLKYFFKMVFSELSKLAIIFILLHKDIKLCLFAIAIMIPLRISTGGIHCKHYISCFLVSFAYVFTAVKILPLLEINYLKMVPLTAICAVAIYFIGPVPSSVRMKLDDDVIEKMRLQSVGVVSLYVIFVLLFQTNPYLEAGFWIIATHTIQLFIAKIIKLIMKGGQHNEEIG